MIGEYLPLIYETLSIAARLIAALVLGTAVGLERQWRHGTTGLTTHALVALGAASYCALPAILDVNEDIRMGGQVVTGIGFLGAGLIMRDGPNIRGLSTSATVWATGAIGVLAGYGKLFEASEATILILCINILAPKLTATVEHFIPSSPATKRRHKIEVRIAEVDEAEIRARIFSELESKSLAIQSITKSSDAHGKTVRLEVEILESEFDPSAIGAMIRELSLSPVVLYCGNK